jgi:hypothetical protein
MHDLRGKLKSAGVPEPNRAQRRRGEALEKLGQAVDDLHREATETIKRIREKAEEAPATQRVVERTSKGVRTVRCRGPRPKS